MERAATEMLTAGVAASLSCIFTNPLDVMKIRLQMNNELASKSQKPGKSYRGLVHCFTVTYQTEGILGLQRGLNVAMTREFCKCCFRIGMYDPMTRKLSSMSTTDQKTFSASSFFIRLLSGMICGGTAAVLFNPLDIAKVRAQASSSALSASHHEIPKTSSVYSILKSIGKDQDGFKISRLWSGIRVNVLRSIMFTTVMMPANSYLKPMDLPLKQITAPSLAALLATVIMNPIDVIRTRLYNQPTTQKLYNGAFDCLRKISQKESPLALWKGTFSHFLRIGPHTTITFFFMENIRSLFGITESFGSAH